MKYLLAFLLLSSAAWANSTGNLFSNIYAGSVASISTTQGPSGLIGPVSVISDSSAGARLGLTRTGVDTWAFVVSNPSGLQFLPTTSQSNTNYMFPGGSMALGLAGTSDPHSGALYVSGSTYISGSNVNATSLTVTGVVSATKFYGDGSALTGISGGGGSLNYIAAYPTSIVSSGQIIAPNANTMVSLSLAVSSSTAFGAYLSNSKFTPTNGTTKRYAVNANILSVKPGVVLSDALQLNIVKNNFASYTVCKKNFPSTTISESIGCYAIVELNGSTDFIQIVLKNNDATNNAIVGFSSQPQIYIRQLD